MNYREAFENFIEMKTADGLSLQSIKSYKWQCKPFLDRYGNCSLQDLTDDDIRSFLADLQAAERWSESTKVSYRRSFRVFLCWCTSEYSLTIRCDKIKLRKMPKKEIRMFSIPDYEKLFDACETTSEWLSARNRLLLALLIDTGMRRDEASKLKKSDIDYTKHFIIVTGKGRKQRLLHYGNRVQELMDKYLEMCPKSSEMLFCGLYSDNLTDNAISEIFYKIQRKTGIRVSPHICRHNFATNYCLDVRSEGNEVDCNKLQALMGHEELVTTKRYMHDALEITAAETCPSHLDIVTTKKTAS